MIQAKEQRILNKLDVLYGDQDFLVCHENDFEVRLKFSIDKNYWTLEHEINSSFKIAFLKYKSINV